MDPGSSNFSFKFPLIFPKIADTLWFSADKPCDDENELLQLETEYQTWLTGIGQKDSNIVPIGKTEAEQYDEAADDEEEDDDDNDDDDSESNEDDDDDDDLDGDDLNYDQDSPVDVSPAKLLAACFVMGLLASSYEGIRILRLILLHRAEEKNSSIPNGETTRLQNGHAQRSNHRMDFNAIQSTLHVVQAIQNYTLMMAVMTYNAWLLASVILGAGIGFYLLAPFIPILMQQTNLRSVTDSRIIPEVRNYNSTGGTHSVCPSITSDEETRFLNIRQQNMPDISYYDL